MDIEKIIEVAAKQGVRLKNGDPLFMGILLNNAILNEYVRELNQGLVESITNVAIKEDLTIRKLDKLIEDRQTAHRKETERTLNQFADNLQARLQLLSPSPVNSKLTSWPAWVVSAFLLGLLAGILAVRFI